MPCFTEEEREAIQSALLKEGERLFSTYGLKKVTVDELTKAVGISKGSFYAFFHNKEHLYIRINFNIQEQIYSKWMKKIEAHASMLPKDLAAYAFKEFFKMAGAYPILTDLDKGTFQHLQRKLSAEYFAENTQDDMARIQNLEKYGIKFSEDIAVVTKAMQMIFGAVNLIGEDEDRDKIIDILIGGVLTLIK